MIHELKLEVLYTELPYWPSVSFLANLRNVELVFLENCEHFVKSSNRNRCWIASANGPLLLTVPIAGGRSHKQLYREVWPDDAKGWRRSHWHSLQSAYGKSPYFEFYADELAGFYHGAPQPLWNFNFVLFQWLLAKLGFRTTVRLTDDFRATYDAPDGRLYGHWERQSLPPYYQSFASKTGFLSDMTGLDVLLHLGPSAGHAYLAGL